MLSELEKVPMKLARYRRVSSKKQVQLGDSLHGQILKTDQWAKNHNHVIIKDYVDEGVSGYQGKRKVFQQLLEDIAEPDSEIEGIIVYSVSRISRNLSNLIMARDICEKHNIKIFSATEALPEDRNTFRLNLSFLGVMAENQSDANSTTVIDRLNDTAHAGFFTGGRVPFGYSTVEVKIGIGKKGKKSKLTIYEPEAAIIRKIFNLSLMGTNGKGMGIKAIASYLNQAGLTHRNNNWNITSIGRLLHDTTYMGKRIYGKNRKPYYRDIEPIESTCPAIISEETFVNVSKGLEHRKLSNVDCKGERASSLLTGLLKCKACNSNLTINTGKGGRYKYYKCSKKIKVDISSCKQKPIRKETLDQRVIDLVIEQIMVPKFINQVFDYVKSLVSKRSGSDKKLKLSLESRLSETKYQIKKLYLMLSREEISSDEDLNELLSDLRKKKHTLKSELEDVKRRSQIPIWKFGETKVDTFTKITKMVLLGSDHDYRKSFLRATISQITVDNENLTFKGSNLALLDLVSKTKMGTSNEVPTFVSIWR